MVKVEIVEERDQDAGNSPYASTSSSRTSSSVSLSSVGSEPDGEETFYERLAALVDIVPPTTRQNISSHVSKTTSFFKSGGKVVGNLIWIVTTSALLVGLPLALSLEDEAKIVAQEKEMLAQQQGAQQVRTLGVQSMRTMTGLQHGHVAFHRDLTRANSHIDTFRSLQMMAPSMYPAPPGSSPNQSQQKGIVPPGF